MQKRANRILSALIALVMVLSMLPATVLADGETASVLEGWNISLGDNIGVKFHLNSADYTVTTTVNGAEVAPVISENVVTVNVAAAQMNDTIVLTVKNGEETVHTGEYSVRQYAETILNGDYADYVKEMVKEMLNYGAAAQNYFGYNDSNLANAGYELDSSAEVPTEVPAITVEDKLAGISLYGMSLVFRNKTAVRFYFNVSGNIADYTFSQGTPVQKDGKYYVEIDNINPQDLANDITLSVNDGALSVTYSPLNYIVRKYNNADSSAELKALVQAMYGYHLEAKYYNSVVPIGALQSSGNGWTSGVIYATAPENDAYFVQDDWGIEYTPVNADVIKLVRGDVTQSVGMPGQGTLIKFTATDYCLKTEPWTISGEVLPLVDQDYLIVEGCFQHPATGSVMYISKTYIYNNNGTLEFTTTEPVKPVSYDVGVLQASANGAGSGGIYFTTAEVNAAPWGDWNTYYDAANVDNIKLIRNGETISIALTDRNTICKFGENDYYLRLEDYTIGEYAPFTTDDVFIVEGAFTHKNSKTTLNIEKTYIYYNGSSWVFANSLPTVYEAGVLQTHPSGLSGLGIYVRTAANAAPSNDDWSLEYKQTSADNIKLVRSGETVSIGIADRPLLIKLNECDYYLKLEEWTVGQYGLNSTSPITTDDMLIIEGDFFYEAENAILNIEKSYVYYDGSAWVCSAEDIPSAGVLTAHTGGGSGTGFHAIGAENDAPYDWAAEYAPSSKECIQIIRNGQTIYRNNTGAGAIIKFGASEYYVKFDTWIDSENYPLQAGDIIIIEGVFVGTSNYAASEGVQLKIDKTYVVYNGSSFTFPTEDPRVINVGTMYAQGGTNWSGDLLNFALDANEAPSDSEWSVEYAPVSNEAIKLIRNGETKNIANTGAGTIIKLSESNCILKLENWIIGDVYPITEGDVLIVEGAFKQKNGDYTMVIDKTYIIIGSVANDEVTFTTHYENTDFGAVVLPTSNDTLKIGMWNGSYHVFEDKQLQELKAAGITKIMGINTQWIGTENVNAWLDRVYSYGISVIFDLRDWDGTTVPSYASHPGVMGFLMYDEPGADVFDDLAALKEQFDAVMPADKLFYVNLFPECAANSSLGTESSWWDQIMGNTKDYDTDYVTAFLNALDIQVLSWDNYSLLNGGGIRTEYFHNFEVMASKNVPMWYTMLSAGHPTTAGNTYATPTANELRWQMAVAMTYGVQNIDHYVYVSHEDGYSCMVEYEDADGDGIYWETTALYNDIKDVDNEYLAWDEIFMAYDWQGVGVYDTGTSNTMLTVLENKLNLANYGLTVNSSNQDLLVGVFDHNGDKAYMVTNAGSAGSTNVGDGKNFVTGDATVTLSLGSGSYKCVAVIDNGEISYVAVNADNTVTVNVQAYEGVFVIPVRN